MEKAQQDFLNQGGDIDKQHKAKKLFFSSNNERGYKASQLNNQAVDLLKQLKVQSNAIKGTDPEEYKTIQHWIKRFETKFSAGSTSKYNKGDAYADANANVLFGNISKYDRPGWTKAAEIVDLKNRIKQYRDLGLTDTDEYTKLANRLKSTKTNAREEQHKQAAIAKKMKADKQLEEQLQEASRMNNIPIDILRQQYYDSQLKRRQRGISGVTGRTRGAGTLGSSAAGAQE